MKKEILEEQKELANQQADDAKHWQKWVVDETTKLKAEGLEFDENKLHKVISDYAPTDSDGNLDFKKGYDIYKALEGEPDTAKSDARKELADTATATTTKGEPSKKDYQTSHSLKGSMTSLST